LLDNTKERLKRACVFVFFDEDGIADRCIDYYLKALHDVTERIIIVSNSKINADTRALFQTHTDEIIVRDNVGYDIYAWKTGLEHIGFDNLKDYDEIILANDSVFGPIYPLRDMFDVMTPKNLDFWGVTKHPQHDEDFTEKNTHGYLPEHIQSYFTVFSKSLLGTRDFADLWNTLPPINNLQDAIGIYETAVTKYFADRGFIYGVYADATEIYSNFKDNTILLPLTLAKKYKSPFVKVKLFSRDQHEFSMAEEVAALPAYIIGHTNYDIGLIYEKALRKFEQYDLFKALDLTYVMSDQYTTKEQHHLKSALILHCYFEDLFEEDLDFAKTMPVDTDIYITTISNSKKDSIEKVFSQLPNLVEVRVLPNRGRSESALIVGMKDVIDTHDVVCFYKEKKSVQDKEPSSIRSWSNKIANNLMASSEYVHNVISCFEDNPYIGMLSPSPPIGGRMVEFSGQLDWSEKNAENVIKLAKEIGLKTKITIENPPLCPLGGSFWFRSVALKKLFDYGLTYDDFPEEPIETDFTILHAIERIYPFVAQDAGYFPAYVYNSSDAAKELATHQLYMRTFNCWANKRGIHTYNYLTLINMMNESPINERLLHHIWRVIIKVIKKITRPFRRR
jgi:rhamnosyltransferase